MACKVRFTTKCNSRSCKVTMRWANGPWGERAVAAFPGRFAADQWVDDHIKHAVGDGCEIHRSFGKMPEPPPPPPLPTPAQPETEAGFDEPESPGEPLAQEGDADDAF